MKRPIVTNQNELFTSKRCLYFRFGIENPTLLHISKPILPIPVISKMLKVPIPKVYRIVKKHINTLK